MNGLGAEAKSSKVLSLAGIIIVIAALRAAREIFIPVAVATLLSFLLAPLAKRLMKWGLPNVVAVLTSVGFAFSILGIVGWLVSAQVVNLAEELPSYQNNIRKKIASISPPEDGAFTRVFDMIGGFREQIEEKTKEAAKEKSSDKREPILVEVAEEKRSLFELLTQFGGPLLTPVGMAGISLVFVIFILLQRRDLRDRLIKLIGDGNLNIATEAVDDATRRVTRYLLMQLVVNATYGFPLGIGLYFIGVPNALLWGLLAVLLRFLPFVGPWLAAFFPITLSIAVDPGWTMPLMVIALVIVLELVSNNFVEPWLYGSTTGISVVALLFAALVWTWVWGPIGLFLSTPLTVCLLVIGKNVPAFSYLNVILGSEPVLPPDARFYQRLLGMDADTLFKLADENLETRTLTGFYDQIAIPALTMAENDRHSGTLAERRQQFLIETMHDLIEEHGGRVVDMETDEKPTVLCVPAQDEADELTAAMFVQVLREAGFRAAMIPISESLKKVAQRVEEQQIEVVCLCGIPPAVVVGVRKKIRHLQERGIKAKLLAGVWDNSQSATAIKRRFTAIHPDFVATTLADAVGQLTNFFKAGADGAKAVSDRENGAIFAEENDFEERSPEEFYDTSARRLANAYDLPISLVSLVDTDLQFWKSRTGMLQNLVQPSDELRSSAVCRQVANFVEPVVVDDLSKDERFANDPLVTERGIRFFAGAPLRTKIGHVVGILCIVSTEPQTVSEEQKQFLVSLADQLIRVVEEGRKPGEEFQ